MNKQLAAGALAALAVFNANALNAGDLAFTSFNADEDGFSLVTFVDIAPNTTVYFGDNEWNGTNFVDLNENEATWNSGAATIAAGTVVRFIDTDGAFSVSHGSFNALIALGNSNETLYVFEGSSVTTPTNFLTAVTNGSFTADGPLTGTGLTEGVNAIRLNALATTATPDFAEYTGVRSGELNFAAYKPLVANVANWTVDTSNGAYAATLPNTTAFTVTAVPEPQTYALMLAGLFGIGFSVRSRTRR
jgi:hypothetical protein